MFNVKKLECKSGLKNNSIIKRDEYNCRDHDQGIALSGAISEFLRLDIQRLLDSKARSAIAKINNGTKILVDLFHRLSLSRRAQIKSALNLVAKNTAEAIPADNMLLGTSFREEVKKVAATEKSSRDIVKTSLIISGRVQQLIKQPRQVAKSGNFGASIVRTRSTATGRARASTAVAGRHIVPDLSQGGVNR